MSAMQLVNCVALKLLGSNINIPHEPSKTTFSSHKHKRGTGCGEKNAAVNSVPPFTQGVALFGVNTLAKRNVIEGSPHSSSVFEKATVTLVRAIAHAHFRSQEKNRFTRSHTLIAIVRFNSREKTNKGPHTINYLSFFFLV